jgi:hypothetical protein
VAIHRRVDACSECGQPWPCTTAREARETVSPRCPHIVASSGKQCARKRGNFEDKGYCRAHYWMHEEDAGYAAWKRTEVAATVLHEDRTVTS